MSAPQTIWLQPLCCAEHDEFGRLWCENDDFDCEDGVSGDEYTRTDTVAAALIEAERRGMMRAAEIMQQWADEASASIDTGHPSGMNVAREQERDLCKEARDAIRQAAGELK